MLAMIDGAIWAWPWLMSTLDVIAVCGVVAMPFVFYFNSTRA